jgi:hypothetical protein
MANQHSYILGINAYDHDVSVTGGCRKSASALWKATGSSTLVHRNVIVPAARLLVWPELGR